VKPDDLPMPVFFQRARWYAKELGYFCDVLLLDWLSLVPSLRQPEDKTSCAADHFRLVDTVTPLSPNPSGLPCHQKT